MRLVIKRSSQKVSEDIGKRIADAASNVVEKSVPLSSLVLDPANPRLRKTGREEGVGPDVASPAVQELTEAAMVEMNGRTVATYYDKMRVEGFIPTLAKIHVAELPGGKFLLCDGNTRVTVMRLLLKDHGSKKIQLSDGVLRSFAGIPVAVMGKYSDSEVRLLWNAVRSNMHILSNKEWGNFQKAAFVSYLKKSEGMSTREIVAMVGGGKADNVRQLLDAYNLFELMRKDREYGPRIGAKRFSIVKEAVHNGSAVRYLEWDGKTANKAKLAQFMELIAPADGGRAYLGGGDQLHRLRALRDNPSYWAAALDHKKNKSFLRRIESFDSGREINAVALEFWGKVKKATPEEIEQVDTKIISDIVLSCQRLMQTHAKLAA